MKLISYTIMLLAIALPVQAEQNEPASFGRLFNTPAQRFQLEAIRHTPSSPPHVPVTPSESFRLDGIVRRGNASALIWINGNLLADHTKISGIEVNALRIVGTDGIPRPIAVGETLTLDPGNVQ